MPAPLGQSCPLTAPVVLGSLADITTWPCPSPMGSVYVAFQPTTSLVPSQNPVYSMALRSRSACLP